MKRLLILSSLLFSYQFQVEALEGSPLGGKAESLAHLQQIPGINVPNWFCVDTKFFEEFISANQIALQIEELNKIQEEKELFEKAKIIRERILAGSFSSQFHNFLEPRIKELLHSCDTVAVRSSCIFEDLPDASFAGIYDTFLNQKDQGSIEESVKKCWASVFNDRAVLERAQKGIDHTKALIAVIVQEMVQASVAGTAFTMEIGTGYEGIEIAANYGLGESIVDGEITVDKWLVHPKSNQIIKSTLGNKKFKIISTEGEAGVQKEESGEGEKRSYCLDQETVQKVAAQLKKIKSYYDHPHLDTEFAIDQKGKLYFLQARPLVPISAADLKVVDLTSHKNAPLLAKGRYGVPGAVTGKIKVIASFEELASGRVKIDPEDIVVTYVSTNKWTQYMTKFKGMITQEGGPTSHPILLCRERKVPCIIGISPELFAHLLTLDGQEVTLDGMHQSIYSGRLPLKAATVEDFTSRFMPLEEEPLPSYEEQVQDFKRYGLCIVEKQGEEEIIWQKKPGYRLDPLMQEIQLLGYKKRAQLLGLPEFPFGAKILDGYVVEKLVSDKEKLRFFSQMDLEKSEAFLQTQERTLQEYEALTENFSLTKENWKKYTEAMATLRAYFWLGYTFRLHANQQIVKESERLQMSRFYIEAYAEQLQSQFVEEDTLMAEAIQSLARQIEPFASLSLQQFRETAPLLYKELEALSKQYRFQNDLAFTDDLDLEKVYKRVLMEVRSLALPSAHLEKIEHDFFPQDEALRRWTLIATKSRILQSDAHHKILRGQWKVREALLERGKGKGIFNQSIEEITRLLEDE